MDARKLGHASSKTDGQNMAAMPSEIQQFTRFSTLILTVLSFGVKFSCFYSFEYIYVGLIMQVLKVDRVKCLITWKCLDSGYQEYSLFSG